MWHAARRAPRGNERRREGHCGHDQRDERKRDGVGCRSGSQVHTLGLTQVGDQRAKAPDEQPCEAEPHGQRNRHQRGNVLRQCPDDLGSPCAEGGADPDLPRPTRYREGNHSVQAETRQAETQYAERAQEGDRCAPHAEFVRHPLAQRGCRHDRH